MLGPPARSKSAPVNCNPKIVPGGSERYTVASHGESPPGGIAVATHIIKIDFPLYRSLMLLIGCCWLFLATPASAQVGTGAKARRQEMDRRELQLSDKGRGNHSEIDPRDRVLMQQVNEDFQRLLKLHNEIVRTITRNDPPDYRFISDAAGEIKKRAARLQSTLGLHKPETAETIHQSQPLEAQVAKEDLVALCKKIESFVTNPIIEVPGTVDAKQLERARRDLESVVELSGDLKKRAEKQKH